MTTRYIFYMYPFSIYLLRNYCREFHERFSEAPLEYGKNMQTKLDFVVFSIKYGSQYNILKVFNIITITLISKLQKSIGDLVNKWATMALNRSPAT